MLRSEEVFAHGGTRLGRLVILRRRWLLWRHAFVLSLSLLAACRIRAGECTANGTQFDRFVVVILENADFEVAMADDYLASLAARPDARLLSDYHGLAHPSQPNYIGQIGGDTFGITDDDPHEIDATNLVDLLDGANITWKAYMEDYPGDCFNGSNAGGLPLFNGALSLYVRQHNPFVSFSNILGSASRCQKIVPGNELDSDISSKSVPQFVYFVPNQIHNGHTTGFGFNVFQATDWLQGWLDPKLNDSAFNNDRTVILVTFDESGVSGSGNHVYAALVGGLLGSPSNCSAKGDPLTCADGSYYTHYSVPKTIEDNWKLGSLGRNDQNASAFKLP
ncbi:acid phosphatase [Klebsormidium nitens]|uniref:Acid phosphatase n=1 Tax=Klebsormidium nitens TaxID=105231 RepID=A0A1Y1IEU0_KLENI|nr:acid phosphatase [Klebsormidium nitens]|eukprot:GAQ87266.1 acid phosphatase [Klebsormidium nitens]